MTARVRDVYFGFVDMPSFVIHAVAVHARRARLVDYRFGPDEVPVPLLDGLTTLGGAALGTRTLTMTLPAPLALGGDGEGCTFDSYRGSFIGVLGLPPGVRSPD